MAEINWSLGRTDPIGEQARAYSYADKIRQSAAQAQAGRQFASGDRAAAATTLAPAGDIQGATQLEAQGIQRQERQQKSAEAAYQYIGQALPVFRKVADAHAGDPDKGAGALAQAFDQLAPEISQVTGHPIEALGTFKQGLMADPQGTIARIEGMLPTKYQTVGRTLVRQQGNEVTPVYTAPEPARQPIIREVTNGNKTETWQINPEDGTHTVLAQGPRYKPQAPGGGNSLRQEIQLRKEFDQLPDVKDFHDVANSYDIISDLAKRPATAQNDLSLIFAYMKMLDPGSVVREGEFANAQNTAGVPDQIRNLYNRAATGQRLNSDQRKEFTNTAGGIYQSRKRRYDQIVKQYQGYARDSGFGETVIQPRIPAGGGAGDGKTDDLLKKYGL